ncbi:hypothetical protein Amsp01_020260 [Amycolatopsis sp. NBRC 101858]|uniref:hypothetical protein n=1 Tax=Amycolatopsis sp. NBRC 101858 TaxID=3032200 RepID=UPI00249FA606|nr:hypothetical protein [Amycolatopsis sp. NBRC 101858]GLY36002.1 hypothetical protein Amsp01_020260 [Amycolatopsis sp. NBRC 101858]
MSDDIQSPKKSGWGELGHKWITAIAALVTALAGAGFFIGRNSAQEAKPSAPATVTVTASPGVRPADNATSSSTPASPDPAIYWSGELEWGKFNFDINPPNYTDGEYIQYLGSELLYVNGKARVTAWKKGGQPGKADCVSAIDADGSNQTYVAKDNLICGQTAEGRIFLLSATSAGTTLRTQVTVWNK